MSRSDPGFAHVTYNIYISNGYHFRTSWSPKKHPPRVAINFSQIGPKSKCHLRAERLQISPPSRDRRPKPVALWVCKLGGACGTLP